MCLQPTAGPTHTSSSARSNLARGRIRAAKADILSVPKFMLCYDKVLKYGTCACGFHFSLMSKCVCIQIVLCFSKNKYFYLVNNYYMKKFGLIMGAVLLAVFFVLVILFCTKRYPVKFKNEIVGYSQSYGVEPELVMAIAYAESGFNTSAVSSKGAVGVMQIMPTTASWIANELGLKEYNLKDAKTNIEFGCFYLSYLSKKFNNEIEIIASYNAGEGKVLEWINNGEITTENIPFTETKNYVKKVLKLKKYYKNKLK